MPHKVCRRLRINPALITAVRVTGLPVWHLALVTGFHHASRLTALLHSDTVPETARTLALFSRLCDAIHFPKSQAFLPLTKVERLRAEVARLEQEVAALR